MFKAGKKSKEMIQKELLSMLSIVDDCVTREEFVAFYDDVSVNFGHNDVFIRHVSQQWSFEPPKYSAATPEEVK